LEERGVALPVEGPGRTQVGKRGPGKKGGGLKMQVRRETDRRKETRGKVSLIQKEKEKGGSELEVQSRLKRASTRKAHFERRNGERRQEKKGGSSKKPSFEKRKFEFQSRGGSPPCSVKGGRSCSDERKRQYGAS